MSARPLPELDTSFMARGACRGKVDLFFPAAGGAVSNETKAICRACPVQRECLDYARSLPEPPEGVWGGLSGADLRRGSLS